MSLAKVTIVKYVR